MASPSSPHLELHLDVDVFVPPSASQGGHENHRGVMRIARMECHEGLRGVMGVTEGA